VAQLAQLAQRSAPALNALIRGLRERQRLKIIIFNLYKLNKFKIIFKIKRLALLPTQCLL